MKSSNGAAPSSDGARDGYVHIYENEDGGIDYVVMDLWLTDGPADASTDTMELDNGPAEEVQERIEETAPEDGNLILDEEQIPDEEESQANLEAAIKRAYQDADWAACRHGLVSYFFKDDLSGTEGRRTVPKPIAIVETAPPSVVEPEVWRDGEWQCPTLSDWSAIKSGALTLCDGDQVLTRETSIVIVFTRLPPHYDSQIETKIYFDSADGLTLPVNGFTLRDIVGLICETYGELGYRDDHQFLERIELKTPALVSFHMGS